MDDSPQELVVRALRKDESAFAELVRRYERTALAIAYAVVRDASTAGDVTQEAFIRAWQRLKELDDPERFAAWLSRIVRNLAADHARRRSSRTVELSTETAHASDPSIEMDRTETSRGIDNALNGLDEVSRSVVVLRYYEGLSSREIGDLLEMSPAAVDMRLSRTRQELREKLAWLNPKAKCET